MKKLLKIVSCLLFLQLLSSPISARSLRKASELESAPETITVTETKQMPIKQSVTKNASHTAHVVLYSLMITWTGAGIIGSIVSQCKGWEARGVLGKYWFLGAAMALNTITAWIDVGYFY